MRKSRRHILLLEDSRDIHFAFAALFERVHGYVLHPARSVKDALGIAGRLNVDIAVVDLAYGEEISARLKMIREWRTRSVGFGRSMVVSRTRARSSPDGGPRGVKRHYTGCL